MNITIDLPGATVKPYVRMTQRSKFVNPQAKEYLASKAALQLQIKAAMMEHGYQMLPGQTPLWVCIDVTVPTSQGHRADVDNICKSLMDACNGILWPDDRWVDDVGIKRTFGDPYVGISVGVMK